MKQNKNYLITGLSGFVGTHLIKKFKNKKNIKIYYTYRNKNFLLTNKNFTGIKINFENLTEINKLKNYLKKIDAIIYCANLAHNNYQKKTIKKVNYKATVQIAKLAKIFKVKKFIFLSTAKINMNYDKKINNESDITKNINDDYYTFVKYKTEMRLRNIFKYSKTNCIILRPALVYGENVKGNLNKLKLLTKIPIPLPFSCAIEKKSFCSINNLMLSIEAVLNKKISSNIFLVCDDYYYSFKEILINIFKKENKKLYLFPIKLFLFKFFFNLFNKKKIYESIFSRMILDNSRIKNRLNLKFNNNLNNTKY